MPETSSKNNCKDLLIFVLHSEIARGILRPFGVLRRVLVQRMSGSFGMLEHQSQLVLGSAMCPIASLAPSFIYNPIASHGLSQSHRLEQEGVCLESF